MAVVQISRIQHRRGKRNDLPRPNLNEGEFGFATDTGELFIGAPTFPFVSSRETDFPYKNIQILTEFSNLNLITDSEYAFALPGSPLTPTSTSEWVVQRTLQQKLDDFVNVKDYGAVGDGSNDDTDSIIQAIIDVVRTSVGYYRVLRFPAGQYRVTRPLPIPPRSVWIGEGIAEAAPEEVAASGIICDFDGGGYITSGPNVTPYGFVTLDSDITTIPSGQISAVEIANRADLSCGTSGDLPNDLYFSNLTFKAINYESVFGGIQLFRLHRASRVGFQFCRFAGEYDCASNTGQIGTALDQANDSQIIHITGWGSVVEPEDIAFDNCQFTGFHRAFAPVNNAKNVTIMNSVFTNMFLPISIGEDEFFGWANTSPPYLDTCTPTAQPTQWRIQNNRFDKINSHAIAIYTQYTASSPKGLGNTSFNNRFENVGNDCADVDPQTEPLVSAIFFADGTAYNQSIGDIFKYDGNNDQKRVRFNSLDTNLILDPQISFLPSTGTVASTSTSLLSNNAPCGSLTGIVFDPSAGNQIVVNYSIARDNADRQGQLNITAQEDFSGYGLPSATPLSSKLIGSEDTQPRGIAFNDDGTRLYSVGTQNSSIYQYNLVTSWDLSTSFYSGISISTVAQDTDPREIAFNNSGTKLYVLGVQNTAIYEYNLGTPYEIATASYSFNSFSVAPQDNNPLGFAFSCGGETLFVLGNTTGRVYKYTLPTPFSIASASYTGDSFSVAAQTTDSRGIEFNKTGTKMFIVSADLDAVFQYTLTAPYDLTTAVYQSVFFNVGPFDTTPEAIGFKTNLDRMFIVGNATNTIFEYAIDIGYDFTDTFTQNGDVGIELAIEIDGEGQLHVIYEDVNPSGTNGTLYYTTTKWLSL